MSTWAKGYWEGVLTGMIFGCLVGALSVVISYQGLGALAH